MYIYIYIYTHIHTYMYIHMCVYIYIYMYRAWSRSPTCGPWCCPCQARTCFVHCASYVYRRIRCVEYMYVCTNICIHAVICYA